MRDGQWLTLEQIKEYNAAKKKEVIKHVIKEKDLEINPELKEEGVEVGEIVELPVVEKPKTKKTKTKK